MTNVRWGDRFWSENGDESRMGGGINQIFANWGGGPQGKNPVWSLSIIPKTTVLGQMIITIWDLSQSDHNFTAFNSLNKKKKHWRSVHTIPQLCCVAAPRTGLDLLGCTHAQVHVNCTHAQVHVNFFCVCSSLCSSPNLHAHCACRVEAKSTNFSSWDIISMPTSLCSSCCFDSIFSLV